MANKTSIEWTDYNWNFLRGCSRVSEGCRNCYAEGVAARFSGPGMPYDGLAKFVDHKPRWTGEISFHENILQQPIKWQKPRKIFVNSMSDLFHENVSDEILDKAFDVMMLANHHIYQILTKRPQRMLDYLSNRSFKRPFNNHIWLGVSVEDQKTADERIPLLLQTPAAIRWISAEPLLGPIDLRFPGGIRTDAVRYPDRYESMSDEERDAWAKRQARAIYIARTGMQLDWVVVGGESGPAARPCDVGWITSIVEQCKAANVPVFVKQLGAVPMELEAEWRGRRFARLLNSRNDKRVPADYVPLFYANRKGGDIEQWPEDLKVREYPYTNKAEV